MFSLQFAVHSEVGRVRKNNQDAGYASPTMLLVCDGMGGAAAGDLASAVASTEAARSDRRHDDPEEMLAAIAGIITRANNKLSDLIEEDLTIDGMGTTFCGGLFNGRQLAVGHIGDSRGYLLRDGELTQFTHDHSWVQSLIDEGKITPDQAETHPHRSLILKVLNGQEGFDPDLSTFDVEAGDRILFCSDGLSGLISDADIAQLLGSLPVDDAVAALAKAANAAGGHDNITVVIGEVVDQDDELDARAGQLRGSAVEVEIPTLGALAARTGKPSGYPDTDQAPEATATDQAPEEAARYAPKEQQRRWPGVMIALIAISLVIGGGAWGVQTYAKSRYFIAAEAGEVAIFNGLPGNILGYPLSTITERTEIQVSDLPAFQQRAVNNTIGVAGLDAARSTAENLRMISERCRESREERLKPPDRATPPPEPSPSLAIPGLPTAPGSSGAKDPEPGYPTYLAPMTPTATAEADPEHC